jgi:hypothetical protein
METSANSDANQSSSADPYPWGEGTFEPTWGTWKTRPAPDPYDQSWSETTQRWGQKEREKVITRGGSPPPKLEPETNLFNDDLNQRVPQTNRKSSDDPAFQTGKRTDGIVTHNARHPIPIHPNQFDALRDNDLPYSDFIPGTDTEDEEKKAEPCPPAQPKTPKRTRKKPSRRRSSKATNSEKDDELTDDEQNLSMYRLSDEDSDSSLTIYYKAFNNNKPEMNESSSESTEWTHRIEEDIARMKEARKRKQEKKKRPHNAKRQRPRYPDIKLIIKGYHSEAYNPLPRTYAEFQASASAYSGPPHWDLCSPQEYYTWTKYWLWTEKLIQLPPRTLFTPDPATSQLPTTHPTRYTASPLREPSPTRHHPNN